jgi:hypothetical protein
MVKGRYMSRFWFGVMFGLVAPAGVVVIALAGDLGPTLPAAAGVAAIVGMWSYEDSFVRAGQSVPLS